MIAWLNGTVRFLGVDHLVLDVHGVGYEVIVHDRDLTHRARLDEPLALHVRTAVREDAITLYGFSQATERELFDTLTTIPGVGPKAAMALLSTFTPGQIASAVHRQNAAELQKAKGVGKKLAELMLLKLKDKLPVTLDDIAAPAGKAKVAADDVVGEVQSALQNLGYRPAVAQEAAQAARDLQPGATFDTVLRVALASLRRPGA